MALSKWEKLFALQGEKMIVKENVHLDLSKNETIRFLEKGSVNLFAIEKKEGKPEGRRTLLATLSAPSLLLPLPTSAHFPYEPVAITEQECTLWSAPSNQIELELNKDPSFVYQWINDLALFYEQESVSQTDIYLERLEEVSFAKESTLSLKRAASPSKKHEILWIDIPEGSACFLGIDALDLPKRSFPLTYHAWIKGSEKGVIKVSKEPDNWKRGLEHYHQMFLKFLFLRKKTEEEDEKKWSQQRMDNEELELDAALRACVSVLNPHITKRAALSVATSPLFAACQKIGSFLNVKFIQPINVSEKEEIWTLLDKISETSEMRYRQVHLKEQWWKKDAGPLLAFYGDTPVALIPKRWGGYEMFDSITQTKITADKAKNLSRIAYSLYPAFPKTLSTGKGLLAFYLKLNAKEYAPLIFYSILAAIFSLFPPFAAKVLMDQVIPETDISLLGQVAFALVGAAFSAGFFVFFRSLAVARLEGRSSNQLQSGIWDRLLHLPASFFRRFSSGNLMLRAMSTERMRALLSGNTTRVLFSGVFSLTYLFAMAFYAPALTLISMGIVSVNFLVAFACAFIYARQQKEFYSWEGKINAFLVQVITGVGKLRTAGAENTAFSKWAHQFALYKQVELSSQNVKNVISTLNYIIPFFLYTVLFGYMFIQTTTYSVGSFIAFNTAFVSFYLAMTDLSNGVLELTPIFPLWERTKVLVQEPLEERENAQSPGILTGAIHMDEICFKYPNTEDWTLQSISLQASPGEHIGIVGPSGSGKSTLFRLLLGFETPFSGGIYYDEKDLATCSIHDIRKQIGVVLQEGGIFAGSIYDNLTCGGMYPKADITRALEISGFAEDVESFPMKLHTYLSVGGGTLSGGQKQRLLIARALLPHPKILLLDEATSALDNRNQEIVIESIDQLEVTRIVIAHRLHAVRNADRIYVMDKGMFVQSGTFEELASKPGLFASMLQRQSL